jgi:hypothetical protein
MSMHSALGRSPFEALFGRTPRLLGIDPPSAASGKFKQWLAERSNINDLIRQHLVCAQSKMKKQADKRRSDREFAMGDMVYMKLQSYVQSTVTQFQVFQSLSDPRMYWFGCLPPSAPCPVYDSPSCARILVKASSWF